MFRQGIAVETQLKNRNTRRIVLDNERREDAGWHGAKQRLADSDNLRDGKVDVDPWLQIDANQADPIVRGGLHVLYVVYGGRHRALRNSENALRHVIRAHALIRPNHAGDGNVDVRKYIRRHGDDRNAA